MSIRKMVNAGRYALNLIKLDVYGAMNDVGLISDDKAEEKMKNATMNALDAACKVRGTNLEDELERLELIEESEEEVKA